MWHFLVEERVSKHNASRKHFGFWRIGQLVIYFEMIEGFYLFKTKL